MSLAEAPPTTFAAAYHEAEARKVAAEAEAKARAEAAEALARGEHVYDPRPYPEAEPTDLLMYQGTGIGALYGVPGCEHLLELGDWTLGKEPK